jgi:hypothetical protein
MKKWESGENIPSDFSGSIQSLLTLLIGPDYSKSCGPTDFDSIPYTFLQTAGMIALWRQGLAEFFALEFQ